MFRCLSWTRGSIQAVFVCGYLSPGEEWLQAAPGIKSLNPTCLAENWWGEKEAVALGLRSDAYRIQHFWAESQLAVGRRGRTLSCFLSCCARGVLGPQLLLSMTTFLQEEKKNGAKDSSQKQSVSFTTKEQSFIFKLRLRV